MKFLITDDEIHNRVIMERILSSFGSCDLAVNGQEAVEAFELALMDEEPYDLICLDIMMPVMDGQETLKRIREVERRQQLKKQLQMERGSGSASPMEPATTHIFMVTALETQEEVVEAFFHGGCTDYLTKPITRDRIVEKLRKYDLIRE